MGFILAHSIVLSALALSFFVHKTYSQASPGSKTSGGAAKAPLYPRQASNTCSSPTFVPGELYNVGGTHIAAGDFRGTGVLDIAIADGSTASIFLNDGLGNFSPGAVFSPASYLVPGTSQTAWGPTPIVSLSKANFLGTINDQIVINIYGNLVIVTLDLEGNVATTQTQYYFLGTNYSLTSPYQVDQFTIADWNDDGLDDLIYSTIRGYPDVNHPQFVWATCSQGGSSGNLSFPMISEVLTSSYSEAPLTAIGVGVADVTGNGILYLIAATNSQMDVGPVTRIQLQQVLMRP